jgi:hypothetical protein
MVQATKKKRYRKIEKRQKVSSNCTPCPHPSESPVNIPSEDTNGLPMPQQFQILYDEPGCLNIYTSSLAS